MEAYENLMKEIDTRILAIDKHLVSEIKLETRFEESLKTERLQLRAERAELLKQYSSLMNAPEGDWDLPEPIETVESDDSQDEETEPVTFKKDPPITSNETKKMDLPKDTSPSISHYINDKKNLTASRIEVYNNHVLETCSDGKNPFFDILSTQADEETEEITSPCRWPIRQRSHEISPSRHQLINAIGGVNLRNISYVLDAFGKQEPIKKS